jgi:hypothetical protein
MLINLVCRWKCWTEVNGTYYVHGFKSITVHSHANRTNKKCTFFVAPSCCCFLICREEKCTSINIISLICTVKIAIKGPFNVKFT